MNNEILLEYIGYTTGLAVVLLLTYLAIYFTICEIIEWYYEE